MKPSLSDEIRALIRANVSYDVQRAYNQGLEDAAIIADKHVAEWQAERERLESLVHQMAMERFESDYPYTATDVMRESVRIETESTLQRAKEGM